MRITGGYGTFAENVPLYIEFKPNCDEKYYRVNVFSIRSYKQRSRVNNIPLNWWASNTCAAQANMSDLSREFWIGEPRDRSRGEAPRASASPKICVVDFFWHDKIALQINWLTWTRFQYKKTLKQNWVWKRIRVFWMRIWVQNN